MKKLILATSTAAVLLGAGMVNALEISGNAALTTDYKFRGISQSNRDPAIQGGFDLAFDSGFYLGTWGSSVDFDNSDYGTLELDGYGGFAGSFTEDFGYDVGVMYYGYPGDQSDPEGDFVEVYGKLSWKDLTVGVKYSDDYYLESGDYTYYHAEYSYMLPADIELSLHAAYNAIGDTDGGFLATDEDSYVDYSIGISKDYLGVSWGLSWVDTTLDEEDVFDTQWGEGSVVLSVSKSM